MSDDACGVTGLPTGAFPIALGEDDDVEACRLDDGGVCGSVAIRQRAVL